MPATGAERELSHHLSTRHWHAMNESLDALADVINELSEKPHDITLHAKHIKLAQSLEGMESEVQSAMEMLPEFLAAGEDAWLYMLDKKEQSVDLSSADGLAELLALYERAEADYLCMSALVLRAGKAADFRYP